MAGEDTTSSFLEAPALAPLSPDSLTTEFLKKTAERIIDCNVGCRTSTMVVG